MFQRASKQASHGEDNCVEVCMPPTMRRMVTSGVAGGAVEKWGIWHHDLASSIGDIVVVALRESDDWPIFERKVLLVPANVPNANSNLRSVVGGPVAVNSEGPGAMHGALPRGDKVGSNQLRCEVALGALEAGSHCGQRGVKDEDGARFARGFVPSVKVQACSVTFRGLLERRPCDGQLSSGLGFFGQTIWCRVGDWGVSKWTRILDGEAVLCTRYTRRVCPWPCCDLRFGFFHFSDSARFSG